VPPLIPPSRSKNNRIFKKIIPIPNLLQQTQPKPQDFNPSTATHLSGLALSLNRVRKPFLSNFLLLGAAIAWYRPNGHSSDAQLEQAPKS
jgi:hypothetical protein